MSNSRTYNSILIMITGMGSKIITLMLSFITRTIFIRTLGAEYLGLNGLFTSVLTMLSLADLGIGSAISYYLYKPVADNDIEKIKSFTQFYKVSYRKIGLIIAIIGLSLVPILDKLVNFDVKVDINIYVVYILFLSNSVVSYLFFAYRTTILNVYQKSYISNIITLIFQVLNSIATIVILLISKNYILTLVTSNILTIIQNLVISFYSVRFFPFLSDKNIIPLEKKEKEGLFVDIKAVFILKLSALLFNSSDNIVISSVVGTVYTGLNSNYLLIINGVLNFAALVEASFIAGVGNLNAIYDRDTKFKYFKRFDFINFWIKSFCAVCFYQLLNPFIILWIGKEYIFSNETVILITLNFISQQLLVTLYTFRETMGLFNYGKYLQLVASVANILLSIIWGKSLGVFGVFLATSVTFISIYAINFIRIVFRHGFNISPINHIKKYITYILVTIFNAIIVHTICLMFTNLNWITFVYQLIVSITIPNIIIYLFYRKTEEFNYVNNKSLMILNNIKMKLKKK